MEESDYLEPRPKSARLSGEQVSDPADPPADDQASETVVADGAGEMPSPTRLASEPASASGAAEEVSPKVKVAPSPFMNPLYKFIYSAVRAWVGHTTKSAAPKWVAGAF